MAKKAKLKDIALTLLELGRDEFSPTEELSSLEGVLSKMSFGEVIIKVVDGKVETIQVMHTYKPIVIDNDE